MTFDLFAQLVNNVTLLLFFPFPLKAIAAGDRTSVMLADVSAAQTS